MLTPTQLYVFDRILSMFGKDIQKNMTLLSTFADLDKLQASPFAYNSQTNIFGSMFWSMGMNSFERFFKCLNGMESRSRVLTKEVSQERAQLEERVNDLC